MALIDEIRQQPDVAARLLEGALPVVRRVASTVRDRDVPFVLIAARGTSDHAAVYAQYALGVMAGLPVALATPSVLTRYGARPRMAQALVVGISQSGRSPDVVEVIAEATRQGAATLAITNDTSSPLAAAANEVLDLAAGEERAVAATKTYTAELTAIAMLAASLSSDPRAGLRALAAVPEAIQEALGAQGQADGIAGELRDMDSCVVLGRGFNLATALEWALKSKELAQIRAQAYSVADFEHGPVASLADGGHILAVRASGPLAADLDGLISSLRATRSARVVLVADPEVPADAYGGPPSMRLPFPDRLPEWLSPITAIVPAQLLARALASARGLDPETPRGLQKVTLTH